MPIQRLSLGLNAKIQLQTFAYDQTVCNHVALSIATAAVLKST